MESVILMEDWNFEEYYQHCLEELHIEYFSHPDVLSDVKLADSDLNTQYYPGSSSSHTRGSNVPIGKLVL